MLLGGLATLLLFGVLIFKSGSVSAKQHQRYRNAIAKQVEKDITVNQNVLKARYALLASYDPLVRAMADQLRLQNRLKAMPAFIGGQQDLQLQLTKNDQLFDQKEELIEDFKSQNALLKNSLSYLPTLVQEFRQASGNFRASLQMHYPICRVC